MRRSLLALAGLCLAACNGIPPSPTSPPAPAPAPASVAAVFLTAGPGELPIGGGTTEITIFTAGSSAGTTAAPQTAVRLEASDGTLSAADVVTDQTGHARVTWTSTRTGVVTARAGSVTQSMRIPVLTSPDLPPPSSPPPAPPQPGPTEPQPPAPPQPPGPARDLVLTIAADPATPEVGQLVTFTASLTSSTGATVPSIVRYAWDFDGDRLPDPGNLAVRSQTFTSQGTYTIPLTVETSDNRNVDAILTLTVIVPVPPPPPPPPPPPALTVALDASETTVLQGTPITFTATPGNLADGETITMYQWDFANDGTPDATTITGVRAHTYTTHGQKMVRVTITSSAGRTATATVGVVVTSPDTN